MKTQVAAIIKLLRAAGHDVWWDGDIPTIADWWATILENVERSEVLLFMVSEKSVKSPYCLDELRYAIKLNRPVLPFILDDHTKYSIPPEFGRRQWYIYDGDPANMLQQIIQDCGKISWEQHSPRRAPRPPEPNSGSGTLTKQFQQAVTLAEAGQFEEALRRFSNVLSLDYAEWGVDCQLWIERIDRYQEIADLADHKSTLVRARAKQDDLIQKDSEAGNFDPLLVYSKLNNTGLKPASVGTGFIPSVAPVSAKPTSPSLMPTPFAWIDIPGKGYSIAKYPITNAQFAKFIEADGYNQKKWWTKDGWAQREKDQWTQPRYWNDKQWNGAEQSVVGVSWYEAIAFCLWLSQTTGEKITLPTEDQWQYAAQGDDGRIYPWGKDWDCKRCNNSVNPCGSDVTTPVRQYEGKGDSPFGVVDMSGNVWEWCLTDYNNKTNDVNSTANSRVLRGGSWNFNFTDYFRCDFRLWYGPYNWFVSIGFRVSRFK